MAGKQTAEGFLNLVKQSGLVSVDQLKKLLAEYQEQDRKLGEPSEIAEELIGRALLTRWQANKLLQGKHKGFFLGKYRLLDLVGKGGHEFGLPGGTRADAAAMCYQGAAFQTRQ